MTMFTSGSTHYAVNMTHANLYFYFTSMHSLFCNSPLGAFIIKCWWHHDLLNTVTLFVLASLGIPSGMEGEAEASSRYELSSSSSSSSPSASSSETQSHHEHSTARAVAGLTKLASQQFPPLDCSQLLIEWIWKTIFINQ